MESKNYFFVIFFLTILITRIFLFLMPISGPAVGGFRFHHWMFGLMLIVLGLIVSVLALFALGWGLFIDELTFVLIRGDSHAENYSLVSLLGTLSFVIVIFLM